MNNTKDIKGITLVALIITIVILMILAVVAVSAIKNDNIIKKAQTAKQMDTIAKEEEAIELAKAEVKLDNTNAKYLDKLAKILEKNNDVKEITKGEDSIIVMFKKSENKYTITNKGEVQGKTEKTLVLPEVGTITYVEGMTWGEWCTSKYNTYGFYIVYNQYSTGYMAGMDMIYCNGRILSMSYYSDSYGYGFNHEVSTHFVVNEAPYEGFYVTGYYWGSEYNDIS